MHIGTCGVQGLGVADQDTLRWPRGAGGEGDDLDRTVITPGGNVHAWLILTPTRYGDGAIRPCFHIAHSQDRGDARADSGSSRFKGICGGRVHYSHGATGRAKSVVEQCAPELGIDCHDGSAEVCTGKPEEDKFRAIGQQQADPGSFPHTQGIETLCVSKYLSTRLGKGPGAATDCKKWMLGPRRCLPGEQVAEMTLIWS